jgi:DNA-binding SARP family transcriptional activator
VRYQVLGPVAAWDGDEPVRLGGPKSRAVLAALLLHANHVVSDHRLCSLVWGGSPPTTVGGQLQIHVSGLRKALGADTIRRQASGYLIGVSPGELDLDVFRVEVEQAADELAAGRTSGAARRLRAALALWHEPALSGTTASLADDALPDLDERRLAAAELFFDAELTLGRPAPLVAELRGLVAEHPYRERFAEQLMLALHRCGRAPEALTAYAELRTRLTSELGMDPGSRLRDLHQRILRGDGDPPPPPVGAASVLPAQLPHDVEDFTGRDAELATLDADLATWSGGPVRVRVLSGMAGVGKSALALRWAHRVRHEFPDGQLHVDLRGADPTHRPLRPATALAALLRALGVATDRVPARRDERARLYRSVLAKRKVLLVLDNAADAEQVRALLPGRSTLVLVTSRDRLTGLLALDGARALPVRPLAAEESRALLVRLLGARTIAADPRAAAELARRCHHLPLALRVAAAELGDDPVEPFLTELDAEGALDRLGLTEAFDLSYRGVPVDLRGQFHRLAALRGEFTASALTGVPLVEARRRLRALADVHLVERLGQGRYRLPEPLRLFAARSHPGVLGGREGVERQPQRRHGAQIGVVLPHRVQFRRGQDRPEDAELVQ